METLARRLRTLVLAAMAVMAVAPGRGLFAQTGTGEGSTPADSTPAETGSSGAEAETNAVPIANTQLQIQRDYERFEKLLYDLAEHARLKDPERAEVLYRARSQSQEQRIATEMAVISEMLRGGKQYGVAADRQAELVTRMKGVLKLLQSLDERERIAKEIERLQELLKDTSKLIARQKDVHADTQRGTSPDRAESGQKNAADQAGKLAEKIDQQDRQRAEENQQNSPEADESQDPSGDKEDSEQPSGKDSEKSPEGKKGSDQQNKGTPKGSQQGQKPSDGQNPPQNGSQQSQSPQGQPQGQPPQGEQQQGQQQEGQQQNQQQTPGRQQLEQARKAMQQALDDLKQRKLEEATDDQQEAIARLEELKAELEKILRQLREEERETYLTLLEARFQNMLRRQERINSETERLDAIPKSDRPPSFADKALGQKREQDDNIIEAEKALTLLREEGSSVAFPEAVEQLASNMRIVSGRLAEADTGPTTQLVEKLIVESLQEMIEAFQKELEKQQQKQQQGQPQNGESADPALVDQLAELKMIRSLQMQVNRLTKQIGSELEGEQAVDPAHRKIIEDLSRREQRIQDATYDLSVGRNK